MACTAYVNNPHNGGTPCDTNVTSWTDPSLSTSIKVRAVHINELYTSLNQERSRRGQSTVSVPNKTNAMLISQAAIKDLYNAIVATNVSYTASLSWSSLTSDFNPSGNNTSVKAALRHINALRSNLNAVRQVCLCNCDHCPCNCDYCTCNCNHCPCNCNHCPCNCNNCTCNCNEGCQDWTMN